MAIRKIGIIVKRSNPAAIKTSMEVALWLKERGIKVMVEKGPEPPPAGVGALPAERLAREADALVVLGGDGTMLHAARSLAGKRAPILGVNLGGLGFLTSIRVGEMYHMLERMLSGAFETEERMALSVRLVRKKHRASSWRVLNDVVIKGRTARLVRLETSINREHVTTYRADGLIVATPTGSTAYSLSAHGPILYPTIHSIIVAPVCPFNLTNRPVVIPDWMSVEVTVGKAGSDALLVLDGQADIKLGGNDTVEIKRAEQGVHLVKYEGKSYFDILRERLLWES